MYTDADFWGSKLYLKASPLGGPEKISNSLRLFQTLLTEAEFDVDSEFDLHFEARGRTPEHKSDFQIEVAMKRFYLFRA